MAPFPGVFCFLAVLLSVEFVQVSESLKAGDSGVCVVKISVRKTKNKYVTINKWCGRKKCVKKTVVTYNVPEKRTVCCKGWEYDVSSDSCSATCSTGCFGGRCVSPDVCQCDPPSHLDPEHSNTCIQSCDPPCVNAECRNNTCFCNDHFTPYNTTHCAKCDSGYTIDKDLNCVPICASACVNSNCTGPNFCTCFDGYRNIDQFTCEPICDKACVNGKCTGPNICTCFDQYKNSDEFTCEPICDETCVNGKCTDPNICTCLDGYRIIEQFTCEPICDKACGNGKCTGPNICTCFDGYRSRDEFTCEPICDKTCVNGKCTSPNVCTCFNGYQNTDEFVCEPICEKTCINGICTGPSICTCLDGFRQADQFTCEPICEKDCVNGKCTGPNTCACYDGYKNADSYTCEPICEKPCVNGECTGPNTCTCINGYKSISKFVCEPICDPMCMNSNCTGPNICTCLDGYTKTNISVCEPDCDSCNGDCIEPNVCKCSEGYEILEGVCRPVCGSCTDGYCSSPGVCSCDEGYRKNDVGICVRDCQRPVTSSMSKRTLLSLFLIDIRRSAKTKCPRGSKTCKDEDLKEKGLTFDPKTHICCAKSKTEPKISIVCCEGWAYNVTTEKCQAQCNYGCENGICVSPNTCQCEPPLVLENDNKCVQPKCELICVNSYCVNKTCECDTGFQRINSTYCAKPCDPGYVNDLKTLECIPKCDSSCMGTCTAPNTCNEATNITLGPDCKVPCVDATCFQLNNGSCSPITVECSTCDGNCTSVDGKPCLHDSGVQSQAVSPALASLGWVFIAVVVLLVALMLVVLHRTWRRRREYETKTADEGNPYGSVIYTVPNTLIPKDLHNDPLEEDDEFNDEVKKTTNEPLLDTVTNDVLTSERETNHGK